MRRPLRSFHAGLVHQRVHSLPTLGVQVVVECLFQMDQPALARAVGPVLQGSEGDGVGVVHARSSMPVECTIASD